MEGPFKLAVQALAMMGVGILASLLVWKLTHQPTPPKAGARAPAFSLPRLDGEGSLSLRSLRGKTVVLNFFASWCAFCKPEAAHLESVWRSYRSKGVVVLGVDSGDAASDARRFVHVHGVTFPVLFDRWAELAYGPYALPGLPVTYVINPVGRIVGGALLGPVSDQVQAQALMRDVHAALKS